MSNIVNQVPYLRTSRNFPEEPKQLTVEVNKSYVDVANAVNARTIGIFTINNPVVTGESFFLKNQRQQTLRQVYILGQINPGGVVTIPHNIKNIVQFTRIYGTCITNFPDYRPIPFATTGNNDQIAVRVDATNIIVSTQALSPTILSGIIVLEWMSNV